MFISTDVWSYLAENIFNYETTCALLTCSHLVRQTVLRHTVHKNALFLSATRYGYQDVFHRLIERVDPSIEGNEAICNAASQGYVSMVRRLLLNQRTDPSAQHQTPFLEACNHNFAEIVRMLLRDDRVDPSTRRNYALKNASEDGFVKILALLIQDERVASDMETLSLALDTCVKRTGPSFTQCVYVLLTCPHIAILSDTVEHVCRQGNNTLLKLLLPHGSSTDPRHKLLYLTCHYGHISALRTLLASHICWSIYSLTRALCVALQQNHVTLASHMLDTRQHIAIAYQDWLIFRETAARGHLKILKTLLARYRINPPLHNQVALRDAAAGGHTHVVDFLLRDARVKPHVLENDAFQAAAANGHLDVCKRLMLDSRVDPYACNERARRLARQNKHVAIVRLLTR